MTVNKICYHSRGKFIDCLDGLASAWVALQVYPEAELLPCYYGDFPEKLDQNPVFEPSDRVLVVDFNFHPDILQHYEKLGVSFTIIDHHKETQKLYSEYFTGSLSSRIQRSANNSTFVYDINEAGCTLTWLWFFRNEPVPVFLKYVKDRDIWSKSLPFSEAVHEGIKALKSNKGWWHTFGLFNNWVNLTEQEFLDLTIPLGAPRLEAKNKKILRLIKKDGFKPVSFHGYYAALFALKTSHTSIYSDIADYIYTNFPEFDLVILSFPNSNKYSLRCAKGKVDLTVIAAKYGGGGHEEASSFYSETIPYTIFEHEQSA